MNGKTAKMIRARVGNAGTTEYAVMPGTRRRKFADDPMDMGRFVDTSTIRLDPRCGRKRYKDMKRRYRAIRAGAL